MNSPISKLPYPRGWMRLLLKSPVTLHRLGLGWMLPSTLVLLTATGKRSGQPRTTVLELRQHGSKLYALSAWGTRARWYHNLLANPVARLQRAGRSQVVRAVPIYDVDEIWRVIWLFRRENPRVDLVLDGISRHELTPDDLRADPDAVTGVRFEPLDASDPQALDAPPARGADLVWVWGALLALLAGLLAASRRSRR